MKLATESLGNHVERIETNRKTLRICNASNGTEVDRITSFFEPHDLAVEVVDAAGRPADIVDLLAEGRRLASSPLEVVGHYARAWEKSMALGLRAEPPAVVTELRDNFFESYDKQRMVMASRIVEFRAWNTGSGELHAGFQQLSKLDHQPEVYRNLASSSVDTHVYGEPDREPLPSLELTVHESDDEEVARHWWVAYDGDGDDDEKVVLLAQERGPNQFYGFWTERPDVVDDVIDRMAHLG
ncbi:DICT sensory domain-containing protein [Natrinema marinum]|uniref:DICT sensory domain-containing protein n=1 Tax=Natrinema marinum TaxID=2961598 RepID=UPI0020C87106|nr:DICT sensory domain-containing protein [Natrinema marinum]